MSDLNPRFVAPRTAPPPRRPQITPTGETAIEVWDSQNRRCDGCNRLCDKRATREQTVLGFDGIPVRVKSCSGHVHEVRNRRELLGFWMLGNQPDPWTGLMLDGCYLHGIPGMTITEMIHGDGQWTWTGKTELNLYYRTDEQGNGIEVRRHETLVWGLVATAAEFTVRGLTPAQAEQRIRAWFAVSVDS